MKYHFASRLSLVGHILFFLSAISYAQESHFFRLNGEEVFQKDCLPGEVLSLPARLGVPEEKCHYFLEEISLAAEDDGKYYWSLPVTEDLNYAYRQPIAVKICNDDIHFLQDYDYDSIIHLKKPPNGFVLKRAMPFQESAVESSLILPEQLVMFVSLAYITPPIWELSQPAQVCIIIHQVLPNDTDATSDIAITWDFKEAIVEELESPVPSFILSVSLDGKRTAEISHVDIKLEGNMLKNISDDSVFDFPPGEYILDIQVDGITFPVFWHQKENSLPYRVFFFQSFDRKKYSFGRMTYFRSLNLSGGVITDPSSAMFCDAEGPVTGGWCLGTISDNFQHKVERIISAILAMQNISQPQVLCVGSSAGGFMALKMAEYFQEVNIAAFNPQVDCPKYNKRNVEHILRCSGCSLDSITPEFGKRMIIHPQIVNNHRCIFYSQNVFDPQYKVHFLPFLQQIEQDSDMLGILSRRTLKNIRFYPFRNGLNAFTIADPISGHFAIGRDFELPIIDNVLRSMARQAQRPRSDAP
ncbi:MAG: hypothetical protein LBD40_02875 [Puniceicoccales bacterium]|jgi:hypothetical protein|nr:hypothetical protein [Puniceicoccales bacterium]